MYVKMFGFCTRKILGQFSICRHLNIWSPLATAFNAIPKKKSLFHFTKETGLFDVPELKTADGLIELKDRALSEVDELLVEATSPNRKRKLIEILDDLSNTLCKVADMAEFIRMTHTDEAFINAATEATSALSEMVEKLNTNRELYDKLHHTIRHGDFEKLSPTDIRVAKLLSDDFEQCGVHLPDDKREEVVRLNDYILQLCQKFQHSAVRVRQFEFEEVPENLRQFFFEEDGKLTPNTAYISTGHSEGREIFFKLIHTPSAQQEHVLKELLNSRHELAQLCGFPTYAHRALKGSILNTPNEVRRFLNILHEELRDKVAAERVELQSLKNAVTKDQEELMIWDVNHFTQQSQRFWHNSSGKDYSPYLSLGTCMDGINMITQALYGVSLESVPVLSGEVWAEGIYKLAVVHEEEGTLGHIYCDFFDRPEKYATDSHFTVRAGKQLADGSYQNPIVVVVLSLPPPNENSPCLLNLRIVDNLFHEMGHALHSMFGRTKYQHTFGTRCSVDFAEVPSTFMENFCSDPRVIAKFAKHYHTQKPIPQDLLDMMYLVKGVFPAVQMETQVWHSMLDQVYHSGKVEKSTTEIQAEVYRQYSSFPYVENVAMQFYFGHLAPYGAKYYSYLVSRAISAWIWHTHFESDPLSRCAGEKYRRECLAHGGVKAPAQIISDYLNQETSASNIAKVSIDHLDMQTERRASLKRLMNK